VYQGDCQPDDGVAQIRTAESALQTHKDDAGLLLTRSQTCVLPPEIMGQGAKYLSGCQISVRPATRPTPRLGQLCRAAGKPDEAFKYYQRAMEPVS